MGLRAPISKPESCLTWWVCELQNLKIRPVVRSLPVRNRGIAMWKAPIENVLFLLNTVFGIAERKDIPGFEDWTPETASFMLSGIARFAEDVLAPLNQTGDAEGCTLHPEGGVSTLVGFRSAWQAFVAGGWNSVAAPVWAGGHGIPAVLSTPIAEFINSANQGFAMYTGFGGYVAPLFESYGTEQQ